MQSMFHNTRIFNMPIGAWDVSNVTNMRYMFKGTTDFNRPIGQWDVNNVMDMTGMFEKSFAFNQPLKWNYNTDIQKEGMFDGARRREG